MLTARVTLEPASAGPVDRRLFGSVTETLGRWVHTGIYEPDHPSVDGRAFRSNVRAQ